MLALVALVPGVAHIQTRLQLDAEEVLDGEVPAVADAPEYGIALVAMILHLGIYPPQRVRTARYIVVRIARVQSNKIALECAAEPVFRFHPCRHMAPFGEGLVFGGEGVEAHAQLQCPVLMEP